MINKISDIQLDKEYYILMSDDTRLVKKCIIRSITNESKEFISNETEILVEIFKGGKKDYTTTLKIKSVGIGSDKDETLKNYKRFIYENNKDFKATTKRTFLKIKRRQKIVKNLMSNIEQLNNFDNSKFEVLPWSKTNSSALNNQGIALFDIESELLLLYIELVQDKQQSNASYILKQNKNIKELFVYDYIKNVFYKKASDGLIISNYSEFLEHEIYSMPLVNSKKTEGIELSNK